MYVGITRAQRSLKSRGARAQGRQETRTCDPSRFIEEMARRETQRPSRCAGVEGKKAGRGSRT